MTTEVMRVRSRGMGVIKRLLEITIFIAAGALLSRIRLLDMLYPFGPAFVAACFLKKRDMPLFAAVGAAAGALLVPETVYILTVTLLICAAMFFIGKGIRWMAMLAAAASYMAAAIVFRTDSLESFTLSVLECLVCLVMIYVLSNLIQIFSGRKRNVFSSEEVISIALGALIIVCMFGPLSIYGIYIGDIIAMFLVICCAYAGGAALGAGVGLALGMALCVGLGSRPESIGMLGLTGMAAGTIRKLKKPLTAVAFATVSLLYVIAFLKIAEWQSVLIEAGIASAAFIAVPGKAFAFIGKYLDAGTRREYEYALHSRRFRELVSGRLMEVSEVFSKTGEMFSKEAASALKTKDGIYGVLSILAESTCRDCVFRKSCWDKDFLNTYNIFGRLFVDFEKNGSLKKSDLDAGFVKKCYNADAILSGAQSIFAAYLLNARKNARIDETRIITGEQLKGVAKVVSDIGREINAGFKFRESVERGICASLDAAGYLAREVCAESAASGGVNVAVRIRNCGRAHDCQNGMEKIISDVCGVKMRRVRESGCNNGAKYCTLRFEQAQKYDIVTAVASKPKGKVSGDSYLLSGLDGGRFMMLLCDGMGCGEKAREESAEAVSLIENFYKAGFGEDVIFDTINRLLVLKGNEDIFSTADICVVDLKTGRADFTKIGAERSYVVSAGKAEAILPGSPPMGILDEVRPVCASKELSAGDIIVMMSDGAADKLNGAEEWLATLTGTDAQAIAQAVLAKAQGAGAPDDDMTVLIGLIREEG